MVPFRIPFAGEGEFFSPDSVLSHCKGALLPMFGTKEATWLRLLCKEFGLKTADDDVHRLAMAITALALQYYVGRDVVQAVRPGLTATPRGLAATTSRLVDFAQFMVAGERQRRAAARRAAPSPTSPSPRTPG